MTPATFTSSARTAQYTSLVYCRDSGGEEHRAVIGRVQHDAGTRMMALDDKLAEVQKSLENILDAIEKMGYATHLQQRYDTRKREEEELLSELAVLKAL